MDNLTYVKIFLGCMVACAIIAIMFEIRIKYYKKYLKKRRNKIFKLEAGQSIETPKDGESIAFVRFFKCSECQTAFGISCTVEINLNNDAKLIPEKCPLDMIAAPLFWERT